MVTLNIYWLMNNTKKIHLLHFQAELFSSYIYRWVLRSLVHFQSGSSSAFGMTRENHFCMILRSFYSFSPLLDEITGIIGTKLKKNLLFVSGRVHDQVFPELVPAALGSQPVGVRHSSTIGRQGLHRLRQAMQQA